MQKMKLNMDSYWKCSTLYILFWSTLLELRNHCGYFNKGLSQLKPRLIFKLLFIVRPTSLFTGFSVQTTYSSVFGKFYITSNGHIIRYTCCIALKCSASWSVWFSCPQECSLTSPHIRSLLTVTFSPLMGRMDWLYLLPHSLNYFNKSPQPESALGKQDSGESRSL